MTNADLATLGGMLATHSDTDEHLLERVDTVAYDVHVRAREGRE